MNPRPAPRSIADYLEQLHACLEGQDPALIQDAAYDAEEYLRAELAANKDKSEADVLELIASTYGAPDEVAAAYLDTEAKVQTLADLYLVRATELGRMAVRDPAAATALVTQFNDSLAALGEAIEKQTMAFSAHIVKANDDAAAAVAQDVELEAPPRRLALQRLEEKARVFLRAARDRELVESDHPPAVMGGKFAHRFLGKLREDALGGAEDSMHDE